MKISQTEGKIFLGEQRACLLTASHRSYHTFNFKTSFREGKNAIAPLLFLNDDTLAGYSEARYTLDERGQTLIIPLVGACEVTTETSHQKVEAGQVFFTEGTHIWISNPYEKELISYLVVGLTSGPGSDIIDVELDPHKNRLIQLSGGDVPVYIGKFDGRADELVRLANRRAFVFVIEGAFEVQNRLLHSRDALSLTNLCELEFESLSNEAIILVVG